MPWVPDRGGPGCVVPSHAERARGAALVARCCSAARLLQGPATFSKRRGLRSHPLPPWLAFSQASQEPPECLFRYLLTGAARVCTASPARLWGITAQLALVVVIVILVEFKLICLVRRTGLESRGQATTLRQCMCALVVIFALVGARLPPPPELGVP